MAAKKNQPKPGKIVRIDPMLVRLYESKKRGKESVSAFFRRIVGLPSKKTGEPDLKIYYVLPSHLHESVEEARGQAVVEKVKKGLAKPEKPVELREVL